MEADRYATVVGSRGYEYRYRGTNVLGTPARTPRRERIAYRANTQAKALRSSSTPMRHYW